MDWLDDEEPLTAPKDPDAGSTWEEIEGRIQTRLNGQPQL